MAAARRAAGGVEPAATAAKVWPGSYHLARHACAHVARAAGAAGPGGSVRVCELGAGSGLPGLATWAAGATAVCLTELAENTPRLREAVALNSTAAAVSVAALDWCAPLPDALARETWDCVLAADCVFWPALFDPLLDTLRALTDDAGRTRIFLAIGERLGRLSSFVQSAERSSLPCATSKPARL